MSDKEFLALIPARLGSKRLAKKNIKNFNGKPLIAWTALAGLKSKYLDEIYVSTESREIAEIAMEYGASTPFLRDLKLATDDASSVDVALEFIHRMEDLNKFYKYLVFLQPTSPLRGGQEIDQAIELILQSKVDSLVSVCELDHPLQWSLKVDQKSLNFDLLFDETSYHSQNYENLFRINGAIYIVSIKHLKESRSFISLNNGIAFIMSRYQSIDIDTEFDFKFAETVAKCDLKS
ncbi:acylneuraminate cytidylyltransferase family protein [Paracoccaceae bacterium]|nr:acylneuraminate cytidylyltransferase family protein [Paracoccaceae bacterium]